MTDERDIEPAELREWANEYDDFDRRAGVLQATWTGGGAAMLRAAAAEIERLGKALRLADKALAVTVMQTAEGRTLKTQAMTAIAEALRHG